MVYLQRITDCNTNCFLYRFITFLSFLNLSRYSAFHTLVCRPFLLKEKQIGEREKGIVAFLSGFFSSKQLEPELTLNTNENGKWKTVVAFSLQPENRSDVLSKFKSKFVCHCEKCILELCIFSSNEGRS